MPYLDVLVHSFTIEQSFAERLLLTAIVWGPVNLDQYVWSLSLSQWIEVTYKLACGIMGQAEIFRPDLWYNFLLVFLTAC